MQALVGGTMKWTVIHLSNSAMDKQLDFSVASVPVTSESLTTETLSW